MAINDPLFSPEDASRKKVWWRHPAMLILALVLVAGVLAAITGKQREPRVEEVEIEIDVIYEEESDAGASQKDDAVDAGT